MAEIVRKLFKSAGGGSSRKKSKEEKLENDDGDYSELHFGPTTSKTMTPSKTYQFCPKTPKVRHDETLSDDDDTEGVRWIQKTSEDQQLQIRHQNKPSLKRRRHQDPYDSRIFQNEEESIYEHAQYQLMAYGRQAERHDAKRRKRREEKEQEQENRVYDGLGGMGFEEEDTVDLRKLREERDQWKREAEKYKARCAELEKKLREMQKPTNTPAFNIFQPQAPPPTFLFQPTFAPRAPGAFNFGSSTFGANLNSNFSQSFVFPQTAPSTSSATSAGHAPFGSAPLLPSGPMAPRYPDPIDDSLLFEDEDTSLSDLSNSSKSSEEGEK